MRVLWSVLVYYEVYYEYSGICADPQRSVKSAQRSAWRSYLSEGPGPILMCDKHASLCLLTWLRCCVVSKGKIYQSLEWCVARVINPCKTSPDIRTRAFLQSPWNLKGNLKISLKCTIRINVTLVYGLYVPNFTTTVLLLLPDPVGVASAVSI